MNASDAIAELSLCMLDLYRSSGVSRQRVGWGDGFGRLAKLSGQTPEAVQAELDGSLPPTGGQALALCRALRLADPAAAASQNGHGVRTEAV